MASEAGELAEYGGGEASERERERERESRRGVQVRGYFEAVLLR